MFGADTASSAVVALGSSDTVTDSLIWTCLSGETRSSLASSFNAGLALSALSAAHSGELNCVSPALSELPGWIVQPGRSVAVSSAAAALPSFALVDDVAPPAAGLADGSVAGADAETGGEPAVAAVSLDPPIGLGGSS